MWAWARLYYAEHDFGKAFEIANQALAIEPVPLAASLFTVGVYAGLAGNISLCFTNIRAAILADNTFFAKAAVEPDLAGLRPTVLQFLSEMAAHAEAEARVELEGFHQDLANVKSEPFDSSYQDLLKMVRQYLDKAETKLTASFKDCMTINRLTKLLRVGMAEVAYAQECVQRVKRQHQVVMDTHGTFVEERPVIELGCLLHSTMYVFTGLCCVLGAAMTAHILPTAFPIIIIVLLWPVAVLLSPVFGKVERDGLLMGLCVGLAILGALFYALVVLPKEALERAQCENASKRKQIAKSTTGLDKAIGELTAASKQVENQLMKIDQELSQTLLHDK